VVDIGVSNFDWVQIKSGIEPGAEVIVSDTKKYRHLDEVAIR
jgi:HlyD family secretion protein